MTSYKHDLQSGGGRKKKRTGKSMKSKKQKSNRKTYKKIKKGGFTPELEEKHRINIGKLIYEFKDKSATESIDDLKVRILELLTAIVIYQNVFAYNIATTKLNDQLYKQYYEYGNDRREDILKNYNDKSSLNKLLSKLESDFDIAVEYYQNKNKPVSTSAIIKNNNDDDDNLETPLLQKENNKTPKKSSLFKMFGFN
jgi:hypothetical protein